MTNKTLGWIFGILIVVLVIVLAVRARNNNAPVIGDADSSMNGDENVLESTEDVSEGSANLPTTAGTAPVTMSYQNALTTYATRRIQFDGTCSATPSAATWKVGTNIMLDNRSPEARTIHLGSIGNVSIKGYGFKIVTLSLTGLPTNAVAVDCGAKQNVAIITVQK